MRPVLELLLSQSVTDRRSWQAALGRTVSSVPVFRGTHAATWYQDWPLLHEGVPTDIRAEWKAGFGGDQVIQKDVTNTDFGVAGNFESSGGWWNTPTMTLPEVDAPWAAPIISTRGPWYGAPCVAAYGVEDDYINRPWADETDPGESADVLAQRGWWVPLTVRNTNSRVYEITGPQDWVALVDNYPMIRSLREGRQHWWSRKQVWGAIADWLLPEEEFGFRDYVEPDWAAVAKDYDVVHLTTWGYLQTAYTYQQCAAGFTTMSGWGPDFAFWLTDPR